MMKNLICTIFCLSLGICAQFSYSVRQQNNCSKKQHFCNTCKKSFFTVRNLNKHQKTILHQQKIAGLEQLFFGEAKKIILNNCSNKQHFCCMCKIGFSTARGLSIHKAKAIQHKQKIELEQLSCGEFKEAILNNCSNKQNGTVEIKEEKKMPEGEEWPTPKEALFPELAEFYQEDIFKQPNT